ncbi:MAG: hypothetical protein MI861_25265, partial [Pirellulales bacterium]|nr:hypothetical protein [Pirellulales bacterium]
GTGTIPKPNQRNDPSTTGGAEQEVDAIPSHLATDLEADDPANKPTVQEVAAFEVPKLTDAPSPSETPDDVPSETPDDDVPGPGLVLPSLKLEVLPESVIPSADPRDAPSQLIAQPDDPSFVLPRTRVNHPTKQVEDSEPELPESSDGFSPREPEFPSGLTDVELTKQDESTEPAENPSPQPAELPELTGDLTQAETGEMVLEPAAEHENSTPIAPQNEHSADSPPSTDRVMDEPSTQENDLPHANLFDAKESVELVGAVERATRELNSFVTLERSDPGHTAQLAKAYANIARVGEMAQSDSKSVRSLIEDVKASAVIDDFSEAARQWVVFSKRPTEGVLIIGQPDQEGLRLALGNGKTVSLGENSTALPATKRVIGLGRIIDASTGQQIELIAVEPLP